jgi:chromosome partitioning protein
LIILTVRTDFVLLHVFNLSEEYGEYIMAVKIAFVNGKGGCGKTTSLFHIAGVLSKEGAKVLVIDFDKQCNATDTLLMNNTSCIPWSYTSYDALIGVGGYEKFSAITAFFQTHGNAAPKYYGVDVLPGDLRLEVESVLRTVAPGGFAERVNRYVDEFNFDYVLVDMPPSNKTLNKICFGHVVDYVIVPFSSDIYSVSGYGDIMDTIQEARVINPGLNLLGVFLSRYMAHCGVDRFIREQLLSYDTFIDIQIPLAADVREGVMFGRPISYYKERSKSGVAYEALVEVIKQRVKKVSVNYKDDLEVINHG